MNHDYIMQYSGGKFDLPAMDIRTYREEYFIPELELESDIFYDLRVRHDIRPYRIVDSTDAEMREIREFFDTNKNTFYFLFEGNELIGSAMLRRNEIHCMSVARKFHRRGYGAMLTKYCVNTALAKGYACVELRVLNDNTPAIGLYEKIGFEIIGEG
ncbi:MAG: GNAT family N-acetyltransferase [Brevinematales bacterium]|nr:GNAT family N-acetyltransferase [Brevinematales bacterium]